MSPDLHRIAASYGCAFCADPAHVQAVMSNMDEDVRRSMVNPDPQHMPAQGRRSDDQ